MKELLMMKELTREDRVALTEAFMAREIQKQNEVRSKENRRAIKFAIACAFFFATLIITGFIRGFNKPF